MAGEGELMKGGRKKLFRNKLTSDGEGGNDSYGRKDDLGRCNGLKTFSELDS